MTGKPNDEQSAGPVTELIVLQPSNSARAPCGCPLLDGNMEEWIPCCTKRFLRLAQLIAGGDEQAKDALQESWIRILSKVDEYRGDPPACAWVRAIVKNCAKDIRKADSRYVGTPASKIAYLLEDSAPGPEVLARRKHLYRLFNAMVDELPPTYRQVVELRWGQGFSTKETAVRLHVSESNVGSRLNRAVKMLRRIRSAAPEPLPPRTATRSVRG